jgi:hypothetical protein
MHVCKADAAVCDGESGLGRGVSWKLGFTRLCRLLSSGPPLPTVSL